MASILDIYGVVLSASFGEKRYFVVIAFDAAAAMLADRWWMQMAAVAAAVTGASVISE